MVEDWRKKLKNGFKEVQQARRDAAATVGRVPTPQSKGFPGPTKANPQPITPRTVQPPPRTVNRGPSSDIRTALHQPRPAGPPPATAGQKISGEGLRSGALNAKPLPSAALTGSRPAASSRLAGTLPVVPSAPLSSPVAKPANSQAPPPAVHISKPRAAPGPLPPERSNVGELGSRALNVGLDFGSSSTKVCVRPVLGDGRDIRTYPIALDPAASDPFFSPSTVGYQNGQLFFGAEAEALRGACRVWPHIKVCVACEAEKTSGDARCYCARRARRGDDVEATFATDELSVPPSELAALYLAWVLGQTHSNIPSSLKSMGDPKLTCSLGVPVDQIDQTSPLHRTYSRIAAVAWRLGGHVSQGMSAATALGWLESLRRTPAGSAPIALCPETGAAVVSHITNPTTREGMYALVDIGAWTTDISFFRLSDVSTFSEGIRTAAFYKAETHRVATGRIDQKAAELLDQTSTEFGAVMRLPSPADRQAMFRSLRETGSSPVVLTPGAKSATESCLSVARAATGAAVTGRFASTRQKAKAKEGHYNQADWNRLSVFLLGGGSEEPCFENFLRWTSPEMALSRLPSDGKLQMPGQATTPIRIRRLQVAAGLAFPLALWPKQFLPSQVEPVPPPPKPAAKSRPDRDELYPK